MPTSLVILAGGLSRRMGRDKSALPVAGSTLLGHLVARLRATVDEVLVAGGAEPAMAGVRWVPDSLPGAGPLAGMAAGLEAAAGPAAWVVACDLPDVEPALGRLLFATLGGFEAAVPRLQGRVEGTCAVYSTALAPRIEALLADGRHSVLSLLERSRVRYLAADELRPVDPELRSFRNLNTPDDYARWLSER
ncbi:MAG: molybdenum cofactor guanylyltransferase [Chloroflexi bacterium]|nr:MAG: molybdenum cofactor guanylyltransferase [Chloroflexota bacterium]